MSAFGLVSSILVQVFIDIYKILNYSLVSPIFSFAKGVEFAIVLGLAIAFFLLAIFITLRQAKRLPTSYSIDVTDVFGKTGAVNGLRLSFSTHSAAESYAGFIEQHMPGNTGLGLLGIKFMQDKSVLTSVSQQKEWVLIGTMPILSVTVFYCSQSKIVAFPGLLTAYASIGVAPWIPMTPDTNRKKPLNEQWQAFLCCLAGTFQILMMP